MFESVWRFALSPSLISRSVLISHQYWAITLCLFDTELVLPYFISENKSHYYPTELHRVQITPRTSTNITRYLYSSYSLNRAKDLKHWTEFWEKENERGRWEEAILKFCLWDKCNVVAPDLPINSFYYWFRNDTWHRFALSGSLRTHQTSRRFFTKSPKTSLLFLSFFTVLKTVSLHKIH